MKVVMIGSGNVATLFVKLLLNAGHSLLQVLSPNGEHAETLANIAHCEAGTDLSRVNKDADIYIIAIADDALEHLYNTLQLQGKLVVHTAGSVSKDVLANITSEYGVLYPLQSIRKQNKEAINNIPLLIDGNTDAVIQTIESFALSLSPTVKMVTDEQRIKLHIGAVLVSNFTNHLYALADKYCTAEGLEFDLLQPLIEETALRLRQNKAANVQTGPAIRNDNSTIQKHLRLLASHPPLRTIYLKLTESIMEFRP